jgi:hypothetical protein
VVSAVCRSCFEPQVRNPVVFFVLVLVVDELVSSEGPFELVLHENAVQGVEAFAVPPGMRGLSSAVAITTALTGQDNAVERSGVVTHAIILAYELT